MSLTLSQKCKIYPVINPVSGEFYLEYSFFVLKQNPENYKIIVNAIN